MDTWHIYIKKTRYKLNNRVHTTMNTKGESCGLSSDNAVSTFAALPKALWRRSIFSSVPPFWISEKGNWNENRLII